MARALWKGAISFSLIHIPVGLFTASRSSTLDLDMVDKRDFAPIGYQRINKATGKPVDWKDIVKAYEHEKGDYVVLSEEDFRRANVEATQTIDIHAFVERESIEPQYFDTPYYLLPEKSGHKVYALLREALVKSKRVAVASVVIRTRQHLAALIPLDDVLLLDTLRYADELLPHAALAETKRASASPKELAMAQKLIDEMSEDWRPAAYSDTYRKDLMKRIEEKVAAGETKTLTEGEAPRRGAAKGGSVVDLVSLLQASLEEKRKSGRRVAKSARKPMPRRRIARTTRRA